MTCETLNVWSHRFLPACMAPAETTGRRDHQSEALLGTELPSGARDSRGSWLPWVLVNAFTCLFFFFFLVLCSAFVALLGRVVFTHAPGYRCKLEPAVVPTVANAPACHLPPSRSEIKPLCISLTSTCVSLNCRNLSTTSDLLRLGA